MILPLFFESLFPSSGSGLAGFVGWCLFISKCSWFWMVLGPDKLLESRRYFKTAQLHCLSVQCSGGPARCPGDWFLRSSRSPSLPIIVTERAELHSNMKILQFQIQTLMNAYHLLSVVKPKILKSNHCNLGSISTL